MQRSENGMKVAIAYSEQCSVSFLSMQCLSSPCTPISHFDIFPQEIHCTEFLLRVFKMSEDLISRALKRYSRYVAFPTWAGQLRRLTILCTRSCDVSDALQKIGNAQGGFLPGLYDDADLTLPFTTSDAGCHEYVGRSGPPKDKPALRRSQGQSFRFYLLAKMIASQRR